MTDNRRRPAVVLGGSMAGLLAARVLADHYDRVIVIDRDPLTTTVRHRRGVPQDRHLRPSGDEERTIAADLVVDATGRGSRTPDWLDALGYSPPVEDRVPIGLGYATRTFRLRPDALDGDVLVICGGTPKNPRTGFLAAQEDGRHVVTLSGILGDHPPTDLAGFAAFTASLTFPDIADALVGAQAVDDGVTFRFPASVRRRYERLPAFPAGLLVIGDALCSFNPVYGQGMTVAAMQAELLARELTAGPVPAPHRWFPGAARLVDAPWQVAVGADLAFPGVVGRRTAQIRMVNSYLPRLHAAARTDPTLGATFVRVVGLLERPESLLRPDRVARVGWARLWAGPACPAPPDSARMDRERPAPIGGHR